MPTLPFVGNKARTALLICLLLWLLCCFAFTVAKEAEDELSVQLKVREDEFTLSFPISEVGAEQMAARFCVEKRAIFSSAKTEEDLVEQCYVPIGDYLKQSVAKHLGLLPDRKAQLNIDGTIHEVEWNSITTTTRQAAMKFCKEDQVCALAVDEQLSRSAAISSKLEAKKGNSNKAKEKRVETLRVKVDIGNEKQHEFVFENDKKSAYLAAKEYCVAQRASLDDKDKNAFHRLCVKPITDILYRLVA